MQLNIIIYLCLRSSDKSILPEKLNKGNLSLHQSKPHPNTAAWTKTKINGMWHSWGLLAFSSGVNLHVWKKYNIQNLMYSMVSAFTEKNL